MKDESISKLKSGLIGLSSAVCSSVITYPIDSVKTNYQLKRDTTVPQVVRNLWKSQGFYRGLSSNLTTYPIFWGVFFLGRSYLPKDATMTQNALHTAVCGAVGGAVANPFFVLKVRSQSQAYQGHKPGLINIAKHVRNTRGLVGFMSGYKATLYTNTKLALQFPLCDKLKDQGYSIVQASAVAKTISNSLFYPLDVVRTIQRNQDQPVSIRSLYQQHGPRYFYRGLLVYNCASVPNFVLIMLFGEMFKNIYR